MTGSTVALVVKNSFIKWRNCGMTKSSRRVNGKVLRVLQLINIIDYMNMHMKNILPIIIIILILTISLSILLLISMCNENDRMTIINFLSPLWPLRLNFGITSFFHRWCKWGHQFKKNISRNVGRIIHNSIINMIKDSITVGYEVVTPLWFIFCVCKLKQ